MITAREADSFLQSAAYDMADGDEREADRLYNDIEVMGDLLATRVGSGRVADETLLVLMESRVSPVAEAAAYILERRTG